MREVLKGWGRILSGYTPILSIEITRECPLECPGCYAYNPGHLGGETTLRQLADRKGAELVSGVMDLVARYRPSEVSLLGGEPLVRYRELNELLPQLAALGIHVQVVTSAVRPIPPEWANIHGLYISVSVDGLQPEHDARRKPATYERILQNIAGHRVTIHCTITSQQMRREGYLEQFVRFWSAQNAVKRIWFSMYTPQIGEISAEKLSPAERQRAIAELAVLRKRFPKLEMTAGLLAAYAKPPRSPQECTFAQLSQCISADLQKQITPCQFGGNPDCSQCGCMASAGLASLYRHRLMGRLPLGPVVDTSLKVGNLAKLMRGIREQRRDAA